MELRDKNGLTEREFLAAYRPKDYPRPSLTADIALFSRSAEAIDILLVRRGGHPFLGKWALPGGFAKPGESITETARRELAEETHMQGLTLTPVGLFSEPGRDPRMWVVSEAFTAMLPPERCAEAVAGDDAADARWFRIAATRSAGSVTLHFRGDEEFTAVLADATAPDCTEKTYRITASGGLAFDHAAIICRALETADLLA